MLFDALRCVAVLLGVVAWVRCACDVPRCAVQVEAQLLGQAELPWEGSRLDTATLRCLGVLHDLVLGLLRRDPAQRSTMQTFCTDCNAIVASATTTTGQAVTTEHPAPVASGS